MNMEYDDIFTPKQAKQRFHELLDGLMARVKEDDPLAYVLQVGDVEVIDRALDRLGELEATEMPAVNQLQLDIFADK